MGWPVIFISFLLGAWAVIIAQICIGIFAKWVERKKLQADCRCSHGRHLHAFGAGMCLETTGPGEVCRCMHFVPALRGKKAPDHELVRLRKMAGIEEPK